MEIPPVVGAINDLSNEDADLGFCLESHIG